MTFFTFDEHEVPQDTRDVLSASAALEITEFELFTLAYVRWYGHPAQTDRMEAYYTPYMFGGRVPPWVRQYARDVIEQAHAGRLDPVVFGVHPRPETNSMARRGIRFTVVITSILVTLHLVAILVSQA
jgi:hypothetical protein